MLKLPRTVRIFIAREPCDMRRQFCGLANTVRNDLTSDPESGDLYVFHNRRRSMIKILFFDRTGHCILAKRLSRGTFAIPKVSDHVSKVELTTEQLTVLLGALAALKGEARQAA